MDRRRKRNQMLTTLLLHLLLPPLLPMSESHTSHGQSHISSSSTTSTTSTTTSTSSRCAARPASAKTTTPFSATTTAVKLAPPEPPPPESPVSPAPPWPEGDTSPPESPPSPSSSPQPLSPVLTSPVMTSPEPVSPEQASPQELSRQTVSPQPVSPQTVSPQPDSPQPLSRQPVSPQPLLPQPASLDQESPQDLSSQMVSPQPASSEPALSGENPLSGEGPTLSTENPLSQENPSSTEEDSSLAGENPTLMAENPTLMAENPTSMGENPTSMGENPTSMGENPSSMRGNPSSMGENPTSMGENPTLIEKNPTSVGENPTSMEENPTSLEENPTLLEEIPSFWKENPASHSMDFPFGDNERRTEGLLKDVHLFWTLCEEHWQRQHQKRPADCNGTDWEDVLFTVPCEPCHCSCQKDCYDEESCCLGRMLYDVTKRKKHPGCHSRFVTPNNRTDSHFAMVDQCREGWEGSEASVRCFNVSSEDVNSHWPVWSPLSNSTYRNEHCAVCNGEKKDRLRAWELTVFCETPMRVEGPQDVDNLLKLVTNNSKCQLGFIPPKGSSFEGCSPLVLADSSPCENSATYESETARRNFITTCDLFFGEDPWNEKISVSALHCALCRFALMGEDCVGYGIDTPFPFMLVMSSKALANVTSSSIADSPCLCAPDETYDTYESRCRQLHCSLTRRLEQSVCVPVAQRLQGHGFELNIHLTPADVTVPFLVDHIAYLQDFALQLHDAFQHLMPAQRMFQYDVFQVAFHVAGYANNDTSIRIISEKVILETADLKIRVVLRQLMDFLELESLLLGTVHSRWNISFDSFLGHREYDASPLYSPGVERAVAYNTLIPTGANYSDYIVDALADWVPYEDFTMIHVDEYIPVLYTLNCTKVSFKLATPGRKADYGGRMKKSTGEHHSAPQTDGILHSVDPNTGKVVLRVDRQTGNVYHQPSGQTIGFQHVEFLGKDGDDVVMVCVDQLYGTPSVTPPPRLVLGRFFSRHMIYLSVACQSLSVVCLFLVLFTHCLFSELRTVPGKNTMALVTCLLLAMLLFEVGVARVENPAVCITLGVAIHFSLLSSFTWMLICSIHMYRDFAHLLRSRHHFHPSTTTSLSVTFRKHVLVSLLVPALIVASTLLGNRLLGSGRDCNGRVDWGYGRGICYVSNTLSLILVSVLPICLTVAVNLVLFLLTVSSVRFVSRHAKRLTQSQRHQMAIYFRMSTLTGVNWLVGVATAVIDNVIVWYIFILLCGLQGLYVFIAFVCNRRVFSLYRALFNCGETVKKTDTQEMPCSQISSGTTPLED